jgi:hypothetical protein
MDAVIESMVPVMGSRDFLDPIILKNGDNKKIVVTGCARSGTRFMKRLLNSKGINKNIGHERLYAGGIVSWKIVHRYQSRLLFNYMLKYDTTWIHLLRNPVKNIQSVSRLCVDGSRIAYQPFLDQFPWYNKRKFTKHPYIIGALNWIEWNKRIKEIFPIDITIRVERLGKSLDELSDRLGVSRELLDQNRKALGVNDHSFDHKWCLKMDKRMGVKFSMGWLKKENEALYNDLISEAKSYGYNF